MENPTINIILPTCEITNSCCIMSLPIFATCALAHAMFQEIGMCLRIAYLHLVCCHVRVLGICKTLHWNGGGIPLQHTCKGRTRRDFFYVSPELQELLLAVDVCHDVWPDHSVLVGKFQKPALLSSVSVWPTPEPFPWPAWHGEGIVWPGEVEDMSAAYACLWETIESSAQSVASVEVRPRMKGRASVIAPKQIRPGLTAPLKKGRKGDFQPEFFGTSVKHAQWVRQARRLQAHARLVTSRSAHAPLQCAEAWGAILRAKGFVPTFSAWWNDMGFKTAAAPIFCPLLPPDEQVAVELFDSVAMAVRDLEVELRRNSRQYARLRRDQNPNLVFADIRPPAVPGVDVLLQPIRAVVEDVDVDTGQVVLDHACEFQPELVIACDGVPLAVNSSFRGCPVG